ncbi:MAG: pirin family protein [Verrucomicrobiota bacterium]
MLTVDENNILIRRSRERGSTQLGWLGSKHSFSFGSYCDPNFVGYRSLRVINEDIVDPGKGFESHPHRSMEILSYVISGELEHKDSLGNGRVIQAGEFQYMSAGSGVIHSEYNPSNANSVHFIQIWIEPRNQGGVPRYEERDTNHYASSNSLSLLASPDGREGSVAMRQDTLVYLGKLAVDDQLSVSSSASNSYSWLQMIKGKLKINCHELQPGDGASIEKQNMTLQALSACEFLLFRLS